MPKGIRFGYDKDLFPICDYDLSICGYNYRNAKVTGTGGGNHFIDTKRKWSHLDTVAQEIWVSKWLTIIIN